MDVVELSDLEEGEILEYDSYSPVDSSDDFEIKKRPFVPLAKENTNEPRESRGQSLHLSQQGKPGNSKNIMKLGCDARLGREHISTIDLESISSEGEYRSDGDGKYEIQHKGQSCKNGEKTSKGKQSARFYGTVEDIMSEIGETICRKSRNYKKRKSKDFVKYSDNSYDLWRDKIFSSHVRGKRRKRRISESDSDSDFSKSRGEKKKKKKRKRELYNEEDSMTKKRTKLRDFDEMRRNLLDKLKKQKAEEELKALTSASSAEVDNSEIREVDMLMDCTNYVEDPSSSVQGEPICGGAEAQEKEGEDESDLIKLRLIALASNKKRKSEENKPKTETPESVFEEKNSGDGNSKEEGELDRHELLLRAEALKTALLKKHQKRLNKLKSNKPKAVESSSDNDLNPSSSPTEESRVNDTKIVNAGEACPGWEKEGPKDDDALQRVPSFCQENPEERTVVPSATPKKATPKGRGRRKKRKSCSLVNSLKENSEKSETFEEDDRTLRSQLLSDLMKKKSLKDSEKKPVLMDSIQTSANQIPVVLSGRQPKREGKSPAPVTKKNPLNKVNSIKIKKPLPTPKIPVPEIQRIIVHLGSEDSSDENGTNEEPSGAEREIEGKVSPAAESGTASRKASGGIPANYEKSVELLLSQARRKIEGKMQTNKSNTLNTPEAVYKHLPPSQRLEYLRLKQKIAERESLIKQKLDASSNFPSASERLEMAGPVGLSKLENALWSSDSANSGTDAQRTTVSNLKHIGGPRIVNGVITKVTTPRSVTNRMKNNFVGLHGKAARKYFPPSSSGLKTPQTSSSLLLPSSQALISKLKLLLKKIKIEKTIEENYEKEISKLKNQLNLFERKKTEQRFKIKKLGEESMKTYRAIQGIMAKSNEKTALKVKKNGQEERKEENSTESKDDGKQTAEGKKVPFEPEKEITEAEIDKVHVGGDDDDRTGEPVYGGTSLIVGLLKYNSPLEAFKKVSDRSIDPNVVMCQFDLTGVCKDEECAYQHLRTS